MSERGEVKVTDGKAVLMETRETHVVKLDHGGKSYDAEIIFSPTYPGGAWFVVYESRNLPPVVAAPLALLTVLCDLTHVSARRPK